jgi:hypothetical protein
MRTYSVGTPMKTVASFSRSIVARGSNFENQIMRAAVEQRAVAGHEQAVHVEDRQRVDEHVARSPVPVALQHAGIAQQVAVR